MCYKPNSLCDDFTELWVRNMCFLIQYLHRHSSLLHAGLFYQHERGSNRPESLSSAGVFEGWDCFEYSQRVCLVVQLWTVGV